MEMICNRRVEYCPVRSFVFSHFSLLLSLGNARFARVLRCAHSFARTAHSLAPELIEKEINESESNVSMSYGFHPKRSPRICF